MSSRLTKKLQLEASSHSGEFSVVTGSVDHVYECVHDPFLLLGEFGEVADVGRVANLLAEVAQAVVVGMEMSFDVDPG